MPTTGTAVDLLHGDSNRIKLNGVAAEIVTGLGYADMSSGNTVNFTTDLASVKAIVGLPAQWTWAQSGKTVTITAVGGAHVWSGATSLEILVLGHDIL